MKAVIRVNLSSHITRLPSFRPSQGEIFYLRSLLTLKAACNFEDLMSHNGIQYESFQECATLMGLFATQSEGEHALLEAITSLRTPYQLRVLFVQLLVNDCLPTPADVWLKYQEDLSKDFYFQHSRNLAVAIELSSQHLRSMLEEHG